MHLFHYLSLAGSAAAFVIPDARVFSNDGVEQAGHHEGADRVQLPQNPFDLEIERPSICGKCFDNPLQCAKDMIQLLGPLPDYDDEHFDEGYEAEDDLEDDLDTFSDEMNIYDNEPSSEDRETYSVASDEIDSLNHHHDRSNLTIYQLISGSKYTTKLAALVSDDDELVQLLNGTKANYTLFAPTDSAFEKLPDHDKKPSKEFIKELLLLHLSDDFYPAKRVLATHTIPTLHEEKDLGGRQRLVVKLGLKGLTVNYFSRIVAVDVFGKNGVIHGIDTFIFFPPPSVAIVEAAPSVFSTLALGLAKTKLDKALKEAPHVGSTFFAPSNRAFAKLGPKVNAFLFSSHGLKYLKALLQYHVVLNATVYSDAYYHSDEASFASLPIISGEEDAEYVANGHNGYYHLDLPTLLEDRILPVDIARWGPFINIRVNGYTEVSYQDGVTKDGVIQVVSDVLIPPKKLSSAEGEVEELDHWDGMSELTEEDIIERLEPFVKSGSDDFFEGEDLDAQSSAKSDAEDFLVDWHESL